MIPHRGSAFEQLFERLQHGLRPLFKTERPVYISSSSATGMMESAIRCAPTGRILCLVNGAFSERFAHIASMCGRDVDRYEVAWGQVHTIPQLDERLSMRKYSAITVAHSETFNRCVERCTCGLGLCSSSRCRLSGRQRERVRGAELRFDEWKLDYVLTGSQKALALPPGLSFAVASPASSIKRTRQTRAASISTRGARCLCSEKPNSEYSGSYPLLRLGAPVKSIAAEGSKIDGSDTKQWPPGHRNGSPRSATKREKLSPILRLSDRSHRQCRRSGSRLKFLSDIHFRGREERNRSRNRLRKAEELDVPNRPHG